MASIGRQKRRFYKYFVVFDKYFDQNMSKCFSPTLLMTVFPHRLCINILLLKSKC